MLNEESMFKAGIVRLVLAKEVDEALNMLSEHYHVDKPKLKVGMPKRYKSKAGCYVAKTKTIHVNSREMLGTPFVILHEFYHHLRTQDERHKGTEKYANRFAEDFIKAYKSTYTYTFKISYE